MKSYNIIVLNHISKTFSKHKVLIDFSLEILKSGIILVTGDSGRGKTTLLRIIMGLESPDSGEVIKGKSIKFSVVFPEDRLLKHLTVFENVNIVSDNPKSADYYLEKLGLRSYKNLYPDELSSGMKRRVALARAFSHNKDVFVFDEPFKGLDENLQNIVLSQIIVISKNKPVVIATHKLALFKNTTLNKIITL